MRLLSTGIDDLFVDPFSLAVTAKPKRFSPYMDITENPTSYVISADVPGIKREDLEVSLHEGTVTISGARKVAGGSFGERLSGSFSRTFGVKDADLDRAEASLSDGVLTVTLPKNERASPRSIEIK